MGEEEKKPEEKKSDKSEKAGEEKKEEASKPAEDGKMEEKKPVESKENPPPPPPPPVDIVLRVYMHCEGCARKVRRCLKSFQGVEDVITDCKTSKVIVKGEKADPLKVLERIQRKSHRQVELISPIPKPPAAADEPKKPEEKPIAKIEEKKEELPLITVVLRIYMHCEACAQEIKKRIQRMKGVESAEPDLKSSQVTVKGTFEAEKLADYVYRRTGKHATVVKVEPEKKEEEKGKEGKEEKKAEDEKAKEVSKTEESGKESKETSGDAAVEPPAPTEDSKLEIKKNDHHSYYPEYYHQQINYPQAIVQQQYYYYDPRISSPQFFSDENPQIFSDENPNACSVM